MAYNMSHVDDFGNELERRRIVRVLSNPNGITTRVCSARSMRRKCQMTYINSAVCIEHMSTKSASSQSSAISSESDCLMPHVPMLQLSSTPTMSNSSEFYHQQPVNSQAESAYENWLSAKIQHQMLKEQQQRQKLLRQQRLVEKRQQLSQQKLSEWMQKKELQQQQNESEKARQLMEAAEKKGRIELTQQLQQTKINKWLLQKEMLEKQRRALQHREKETLQEAAVLRRLHALQAWQQWLKDAPKKPKPVPLNRGVYTLRGSINDMYINPNTWQSILPEKLQEQ